MLAYKESGMRASQFKESLSFLSGPMMNTALMVSGKSLLSLFVGSSMPSVKSNTVNSSLAIASTLWKMAVFHYGTGGVKRT